SFLKGVNVFAAPARNWFGRSLLVLSLAVAIGCRDEPTRVVDAPASAVQLEASAADAQVGDRILVVVHLAQPPSSDRLAGIQRSVRFDATRLKFVGQIAEPPTLVMLGDARAGDGVIRLLGVDPDGLPARAAILAFEVMAPEYLHGLRLEGLLAVTQGLRTVELSTSRAIGRISDALPMPSTDLARRLGAREWNAWLAPPSQGQPERVPGQIVPGLRYGDVNLDGTINVLDVVMTANVATGQSDLLVNPSVDMVIAGNVAPFDLPGLGEVGDAVPPGRNSDGTFTIDVLDLVAISNEIVGRDQAVVGELIPGRVTPATARVVVADSIPANRMFFRDTVYELHGTVVVPGGVTLTIAAGTTVEGDVATRGALAVRRGGRLRAVGTRLQPIVFTCNAATKTPGCWGGISLNGSARLNNGSSGQVGCLEKVAPMNGLAYGGCVAQDTSGALRYVRIENGGMARAGGATTPSLALMGVGSGTVVDSIQVHASAGDGVFISGGAVDLQSLFITASAAAG